MQSRLPSLPLLVAGLFLVGDARSAEPRSDPTAVEAGQAGPTPPVETGHGLVMVDYQSIPLRGYPPIDFAGVHALNQFTDWLWMGVGAHAPLVKGTYGGFMAFDATLHVERRIRGNLFADAGASLGGGAGGNSAQQAKVIAGAGGFLKAYAGLGYHFADFSAGVNVSRLRFTQSAIDGTQAELFLQLPFSYTIGSYANAGRHYRPAAAPERPRAAAVAGDDLLVVGLDNLVQIRPKGDYKGTVNLVDAQFDHFVTDNAFLLFEGSIGYRGLPTYNQIFGGAGYRLALAPEVQLYAQLAVGSGGYAPVRIDTGPGLLVYPKLAAEYRLNDRLGLSLTGGYLFAPKGSSRNVAVGAALNYHLSGDGAHAADGGSGDVVLGGHRFHVFQQTELLSKIGQRRQDDVRLLSLQLDDVVSDHVYVPLQASIAYSRFLGYPGYGELLAGLGLQTAAAPERTLQAYVQLQSGINVHGLVVKPAAGLDIALNDRLALFAQVGETVTVNAAHLYPAQYRFRATDVGLGLTYRFSLPR